MYLESGRNQQPVPSELRGLYNLTHRYKPSDLLYWFRQEEHETNVWDPNHWQHIAAESYYNNYQPVLYTTPYGNLALAVGCTL